MKEFVPLKLRIQSDIDRSKENDEKHLKRDKNKFISTLFIATILCTLEVVVWVSGGKKSVIGISLLYLASYISVILLNVIRPGVIFAMFIYYAINTSAIFLLYCFGFINVDPLMLFGMVIICIVGMPLSGMVGIVNGMEDIGCE